MMKTVYLNLHALRAIVRNVHERENEALPYIISATMGHLYGLFLS